MSLERISPTESWRIIRFSASHTSAMLAKLQAAKQKLHECFQAPASFCSGDTHRMAFVAANESSLAAKLDLACSLIGQSTATAALEEQGIYVDSVSNQSRRIAFLFQDKARNTPKCSASLFNFPPPRISNCNERMHGYLSMDMNPSQK